MDPKKRLVIIGPAAPFRGGIAHFSNRWAQALAGRFDVRLLTFSRQYPGFLFPGKTQFETAEWDLPHTPVRLLDSIDPRSWGVAGRWVADQEPDVVLLAHWLPFFVPSYLGLLRAMRARSRAYGRSQPRVVLLLHTVRPHKRFPFTIPLMRRLIGAADAYVTLSAEMTRALLELKPEAVVMEGFHPVYDIFAPPIDPGEARRRLGVPDRPTLLFFGYVRHYKGLDLLIEALPRVREQVDVQLLIAGEFYDDEPAIRARVQALDLEEAVHFFSDYIPNEAVHLYFSAADVVVQPYRTAAQSGVTQTAFYFGKPLIVTQIPVLAEVVLDGVAGLLVPPEDPAALADAVVRFYEGDPATLAAGAREQAETYSWDALVGRLTAFLEQKVAPT